MVVTGLAIFLVVTPARPAPPSEEKAAQKEKTPQEVPQRVRVSKEAMEARLVRKVDPKYPKEAKKYRVVGTVVFRILVDRDGRVSEIKLLRGDPVFVQAATEAVRKWRYEPVAIRGQHVEVETEAECEFSLKKP